MKNSIFAPVLIFSILVVLLTWLFFKTQAGRDVAQHQEALKLVHLINHDLAELNQEEYKIQAGVKKDYDRLGDMTNNILRYSNQLYSWQARQHAANSEVKQVIDELQVAVINKAQLVDRFVEKHAILRNSLDYFPTMAMQVKQAVGASEFAPDIRRLEQLLMYYVFSNDSSLYTETLEFIDKLSIDIRRSGPAQHVNLDNFLAHARYIVEGKRESHLALNEINNTSILKMLQTLETAYENQFAEAGRETERYRYFMYVTSITLVGLIAYMTLLWSRNAIALWGEQQKAQVTLASIGDGVIVTDKHGVVQYLNPVAERMTGWQNEDGTGRPLDEVFNVIDEKKRTPLKNCIYQCLAENKVIERGGNTILITRSSQEISIEHSAAPICDKKQRVSGAIIVFADISETRRMSRALEWQATHDVLTGLVNRLEFENRLNEALITAKQDKEAHGLLYIDLDQFKIVNDTCGHFAGDELLKQVVTLLKKHLRQGDTFARLGGDEFAIVLPYCKLMCTKAIAESMLSAMQQFRFLWEGKSFRVGASIGIVEVTPDWHDVTTILSAADVACYSAKEAGRNRIHIYEPTDQEISRRRNEMQWVSRILDAINENHFQLYSQPILSLRDAADCNGFDEILIRLIDDDGSVVLPGSFIPAAERYKLMPMVDRWVIQQVFQYYADCRRQGHPETMLSINLSGSSLSQPQLIDFIKQTMQRCKVDPRRICFEITETEAIASLNETSHIITSLRELGFRFALDDFGTGMASFSYLKSLPVDYIKIDGHIIRDILTDNVSRLMVEMITQLAREMKISTIAEFVENDAILAAVREIGMDYAQGYACGRPKAHCDIHASASTHRQSTG